jgi:predicted nuclease of predicted toxin-antitoxin system
MEWARANRYIVFTHDLDFGSLLAATGAETPSVIQIPLNPISVSTACSAAVESTGDNATLGEA